MKKPLTKTLVAGLISWVIVIIVTWDNSDGRRGFWNFFMAVFVLSSAILVARRSKQKA